MAVNRAHWWLEKYRYKEGHRETIDATKRKQARSLGTILHGNPLIKVTIWNLKKWSHMLALFLCLSPFSLYLYRSHSLRYASVIISWIQTASPSTTTPILSLTRIQTGGDVLLGGWVATKDGNGRAHLGERGANVVWREGGSGGRTM